jgi:hypothetical protein
MQSHSKVLGVRTSVYDLGWGRGRDTEFSPKQTQTEAPPAPSNVQHSCDLACTPNSMDFSFFITSIRDQTGSPLKLHKQYRALKIKETNPWWSLIFPII